MTKEYEERLKKVEELRKLGINPYAYRFDRTHAIKEIIESYSNINPEEKLEEVKVRIAGRIRSIREHGKAIFADIEDFTGRIQLFLDEATLGKENFFIFHKYVDVADIIGVDGFIFKTKRGELSVWVNKFEILTKSLRGLPKEWFGLKDIEARYRRRYLDMLMNPEVREKLIKRSNIINAIREFLINKGYIEVETPILQPIYGGAFARPFKTYHHELKMEMYLRISNEMYLKRLIAGGFEKVFEFSVDFRNEGIDRNHNPEFLQLEAMTAYADYFDGMKLFEELVAYAAKKVLGTTKINYLGVELDFSTPWKRMTMVEAIKEYAGIDAEKLDIKDLIENARKLKHNIEIPENVTKGELINIIFEEIVQEKLIGPIIIYDYPKEVSPLAKVCRDNPNYTERFEVFVCGMEIGNNYTEINDPIMLRDNLIHQLKRGTEEHPLDEDFLLAMEHGMPPTCGIGIGIDRLVMIFTNSRTIREVIAFPQLREKED
ncbi:MAG: lysine--tRNA ligase [Candidatus Aenigmatarchaeota archaeon]